jgi:hypothetical protein
MMNQADGWMSGWAGGGMGLTVVGILVAVLLVADYQAVQEIIVRSRHA